MLFLDPMDPLYGSHITIHLAYWALLVSRCDDIILTVPHLEIFIMSHELVALDAYVNFDIKHTSLLLEFVQSRLWDPACWL